MKFVVLLLLVGLWMILAACAPTTAEPPVAAPSETVEIVFFSPQGREEISVTLTHVASGQAEQCTVPCTVLTYAHERYRAETHVAGCAPWLVEFTHTAHGSARFPVSLECNHG